MRVLALLAFVLFTVLGAAVFTTFGLLRFVVVNTRFLFFSRNGLVLTAEFVASFAFIALAAGFLGFSALTTFDVVALTGLLLVSVNIVRVNRG